MANHQSDEVARNGWTSVPVDLAALLGGKSYIHEPTPLLVDDIKFPDDDPVVAKVQKYARERLPPKVFNHSMRVFYFGTGFIGALKPSSFLPLGSLTAPGMAIVQQQFPQHAATFSPSTLALTCLLHDIGTTDENITATRMSFEFHGAITALNLLQSAAVGGERDQAEAVCEAIIRHQDLGVDGTITFLGAVVHLATIYDNVGSHRDIPGFARIIHAETMRDVNARFERTGWLGFFAGTIRRELGLKPWCHTTHIVSFDKKVEENELMRSYE
jgi:cyanamide hydratase